MSRLVWLLISLAFAGQSVAGSDKGTFTASKISQKNYKGKTLRILAHQKPVIGGAIAKHAQEFEKLTGAKITITHVPFQKLRSQMLWGLGGEKHEDLQYDMVFTITPYLLDIEESIAKLPPSMTNSPEFKDVAPFYKKLASYNDDTYLIPIDGDRFYLQYRHDLLENKEHQKTFKKLHGQELQVPKTWDDLEKISQFFHNNKNEKNSLSGMLLLAYGGLVEHTFIAISASFAKHPDVKNGFFFDLETMEPQINNPGFVKGLETFSRLMKTNPKKNNSREVVDITRQFANERCCFATIYWDDPFISAQEKSNPLLNNLRTSKVPGSHQVWNRKKKRWDNFEKPNRPNYLTATWAGAVSKYSQVQDLAFDFGGYLSNYKNHRSDLTIGEFGINPFKISDTDLDIWTQSGVWSQDVAHNYIDTIQSFLVHNNGVFPLRLIKLGEYMKALHIAIQNTVDGRVSAQAALDAAAMKWKKLNKDIGVSKQREMYRAVVQLEDLRVEDNKAR